jgi:Fe-S-cluster containining protein
VPQTSGKQLSIDVETPDGRLRGNLVVPDQPMRLAELAWNMMTISDALTDLAVRREEREGRPISCRKGCGACCRQLVPLSAPEAWLVADLVARMAEPSRSAVVQRFARAGQALSEVRERSGAVNEESAADREAVVRAYFAEGIACPFLKDEACSIHSHRPSICREYLVTSAPEHCALLLKERITRVPVAVRLREALARLTANLLGGTPEEILLPSALDWAAAHAADGERTWDGEWLVEGLVRELGAA